jgi:hypothetical protein
LDKKVSYFQTFGLEVLFTAIAVKDLKEGNRPCGVEIGKWKIL